MRVLLDPHAISAHVDALAVWAQKRFGTSPIVLAGVLDGALFCLFFASAQAFAVQEFEQKKRGGR